MRRRKEHSLSLLFLNHNRSHIHARAASKRRSTRRDALGEGSGRRSRRWISPEETKTEATRCSRGGAPCGSRLRWTTSNRRGAIWKRRSMRRGALGKGGGGGATGCGGGATGCGCGGAIGRGSE
ncbi:hypothetical protein M0R45_011036 [Rubus argutus]|uniref:Uncharacterized protein n=1 Tax=Rubus argutus TaxID=59490 RepID=A0AAW1YCV2_RUBAR